MSKVRLKMQDIILEKDFGSFITGNGAIGLNKVLDKVQFGKNKPHKRKGTDVANSEDGGLSNSIANAMFSADLAATNLQNMGIRISDIDDQDTIDSYKALKTFPFSFSINKVIGGFFNGESKDIEGKASVDQRSNAKKFIIYFTHEGENGEVVYTINFSPKTLQKNLMKITRLKFLLVVRVIKKVKDKKVKDKKVKDKKVKSLDPQYHQK
mgnify:CR=1 FL=1